MYYEALYELLETNRDICLAKIDEFLRVEIDRRGFGDFDREKFAAYRDACQAFIAERIEMYNPIGCQYLFDKTTPKQAFEMELQLNWYDSRQEYEDLLQGAREKTRAHLSEDKLKESAHELVRERGAYPDRSIIADYETDPALNKLPDYVVARLIEEIIR